MDFIYEEYRGFTIKAPKNRTLGTIFPVFAEIKACDSDPEVEKFLKKQSGDLIEGDSPRAAVANARRHIDLSA